MSLESQVQRLLGECPMVLCHPRYAAVGQHIANELGVRFLSTTFCQEEPLGPTTLPIFFLDPEHKVDPALFAYVFNKYGPGHTWTPDDAL